jgi:hypothetical protein
MTLRLASASALRATADKSLAQGRRRLNFVAACTVAFILTLGSSSAVACPMCFGAEESSLIDGAKLGILVMLGITFTVQGAFLAFFLYLRKRAKRIADADLDNEWSELQGASRTS